MGLCRALVSSTRPIKPKPEAPKPENAPSTSRIMRKYGGQEFGLETFLVGCDSVIGKGLPGTETHRRWRSYRS